MKIYSMEEKDFSPDKYTRMHDLMSLLYKSQLISYKVYMLALSVVYTKRNDHIEQRRK